MKAVPCLQVGCKGENRNSRFLGRATAALPDGSPYLMATPSTFPVKVKCNKCKRQTVLTAAAWNALPELSVESLRKLRALDALAKDWVGSGLEPAHAHDMIGAGFMGPGEDLAPQPERKMRGEAKPAKPKAPSLEERRKAAE